MFVDSISKYVDLNLFMRTVSAESFMAEWDGILGYAGMANFYLYRFEKTTRHQFLIWDSDNTFRAVDYPILEGHRANILMNRSMGVPALSEAYFQGLLDAATSAEEVDLADLTPKGWLEREIDRTLGLIQQAMYTDPNKPYTNQEFDAATVELRSFAVGRGAFVRCEVAKESRLIEKGPDCF
jgi:hypothetical protein